jgi:hypothetical protein
MFKSIEMHFLGEISRPVEGRIEVRPVNTLDEENVRL